MVPRMLALPCRQLANLFWIGVCRTEEIRHYHTEGHAFTAWWVHNSIEFAEGTKHYSWDDWAIMRGLNYGKRKSLDETIEEINAKWDAAFYGKQVKFAPVASQATPMVVEE